MGSDEGSRTDEVSGADSVTTEEEARLDEAMRQADDRLVVSLQREELRRRRRRRWAIGGIAMSMTVAAIVTVFIVASPATRPAEGDIEKAAGLTDQGWKLWRQHKYPQAEEAFEKAVKLDPKSTNAWNGLGWSRFNGGNGVEAEKAFLECVKLDKSHPAALNGLGQVHLFRRQYEKAETYLLKAAERNAPAAWYGLTKIYLLQGKYADAAKWAEKVVKSQPADEGAKKMLAAAKAKKLDAALRRLIEPPDPAQQSAESKRGWFFFQRGEYARAIGAFRQALKKNPNEVNAHNGLGFCLLNRGQAAEAKPHFETCLKLQPEHAGAMNGLARCLKEGEGDIDGAIKIWEKMVKQFPGPHAGTGGLAWAYLENKQFAKAIKYFEQLTKANPDDTYSKQGLEQARKGLAESEKK